jgi:NADH-quinone oxidoreductase subunit K
MIRVFLGSALAGAFIVGLGLIALAAGGSRSLNAYLTLSVILFAIGMFGFLARRNAISMLMAIELMLNAVNLAIIGFASFLPLDASGGAHPRAAGSVIALLVMAVAAGEATVGLSIILAIYRNKKTPLVDEYDAMSQ